MAPALIRESGRRFTTITAAMLINAVFYAVETTPLAGVGFPYVVPVSITLGTVGILTIIFDV